MTADAGFSGTGEKKFEWDGENRLVVVRKADNTLLAAYAYDHLGRRIRKTTTSAAYGGAKDVAYLYDGWNIVTEYAISSGPTFDLEQAYTWGLDLSGALQGAGGVGGLLCVNGGPDADGSGNRTWGDGFYPTYDGNGNVSEYLDESGTEAAHYEYDPFGNILTNTGLYAANFLYRFSTKPWDAETGLYYYGYRCYDPATGRWTSKDPIGERGGLNVYGFLNNSATKIVDNLGFDGFEPFKNPASEMADFARDPDKYVQKKIEKEVVKAYPQMEIPLTAIQLGKEMGEEATKALADAA